MGTGVPQNVLMDASTSLRLPQTIPQVHKTQKQNGKAKQKTRLPQCDLDIEKSHKKTRQSGTEMRTMGEKKMEKYFFLDVVI